MCGGFPTLTLYHSLGNGRAFAYQAGIAGESDREAQIVDYGLRVIFRRRIYREWLFLELRSSITWPRAALVERRELNLGAGAAIELMFGERRRNDVRSSLKFDSAPIIAPPRRTLPAVSPEQLTP